MLAFVLRLKREVSPSAQGTPDNVLMVCKSLGLSSFQAAPMGVGNAVPAFLSAPGAIISVLPFWACLIVISFMRLVNDWHLSCSCPCNNMPLLPEMSIYNPIFLLNPIDAYYWLANTAFLGDNRSSLGTATFFFCSSAAYEGFWRCCLHLPWRPRLLGFCEIWCYFCYFFVLIKPQVDTGRHCLLLVGGRVWLLVI